MENSEVFFLMIDGGTSRTRVELLSGAGRLIDTCEQKIGVRNTVIDGQNGKLKSAVGGMLHTMLEKHALSVNQLSLVLASGMLTSNLGLCELPHLEAPTGLNMLAKNLQTQIIEDVFPLPITFIPGIQNHLIENENEITRYEQQDMLRGEEVEALAVLHLHNPVSLHTPLLLILPGSHHKYVQINGKGEIAACMTTLSGELLNSLTRGTVVRDAVAGRFVTNDDYSEAMILDGYETARKFGLGRAAFAVRIRQVYQHETSENLANYLLGVVLATDVEALEKTTALKLTGAEPVIIAGNHIVCRALQLIFRHTHLFSQVYLIESNSGEPSLASQGSYLVAQSYLQSERKKQQTDYSVFKSAGD